MPGSAIVYRGWNFSPYGHWLRCSAGVNSIDITLDIHEDSIRPHGDMVFVHIINKSKGPSIRFTCDTSELVHFDEFTTLSLDDFISTIEAPINLFRHKEVTFSDNEKRLVLPVTRRSA